jgi:F420-dependent methylenetetrahydromethanopterin dehydrogenase
MAALVAATALLIPSVRTQALQRAGSALVAEDPLAPADAIVIGPDVAEAGALEAADLVKRGVATRVMVIGDPMTAISEELTRRGVPYEDPPTQLVQLLNGLGVHQSELLRLSVGGTGEASRLLREWCDREQIQSVVLVTGADHSRRVRRVVRRIMHGSRTHVIVRVSRYSAFAPERWWRSRGTLRTGIVELQKLVLDVVQHPFS